ncbi:uncharacterized protein KY384_009098 [Bacidia gigantensis]|uniref:uncharacterized protein n=1 Tax=Bacidia gigantensis TaxID=2732470 RepID=UPI001D05614D|nr:uncharacterized protein KY384_009098 [Bacidia gigantensis]KAG8525454.1 hypothetical protein KY384_009098 [Bacidia gigantensis]
MRTGILAVTLLGMTAVQAAAVPNPRTHLPKLPEKNMCHEFGEACTKLRRAVDTAAAAIDSAEQPIYAKRAALALAEAAANTLTAYDPNAGSCYATNGTCNVAKSQELAEADDDDDDVEVDEIEVEEDLEKREARPPRFRLPEKNMCHEFGEPCTKLKRAVEVVDQALTGPGATDLSCEENDETCENAKRSVQELSNLAGEYRLNSPQYPYVHSTFPASSKPGVALQPGESGFRDTVKQHYSTTENNTLEKLIHLKRLLRNASRYDFWRILMNGMTDIAGAQYGFVSNRILFDDEKPTVEMPPIGEPGSCLLGVAFYWNDGGKLQNLARDYKYWASGSPCAYLKYEKVFLIPDGLPKVIPNNPNPFPFPAEAYIGIPLFANEKCFGHFGMMWNQKGLQDLKLGWANVEMLLHSLEDLVLDRALGGQSLEKEPSTNVPATIQSTEAVSATQQSLKPYAKNLSHELRTPMQGVVGMLDVMHATVQESLEEQYDPNVRQIFKVLRENIEVVQDSSRRAVEAADNVVHAYDLNMQVPDTHLNPIDFEGVEATSNMSSDQHQDRQIGKISAESNSNKRRRTSESTEGAVKRPPKHQMLQSSFMPSEHRRSSYTAGTVHNTNFQNIDSDGLDGPEIDSVATPGLRQTHLRDLLQLTINESLRVGERPESAFAQENNGGEIIEVKMRNVDDQPVLKTIDWSMDADVPEMILVDERDLAKLISCVLLNAIKFTEEGKITLKASLSTRAKFIIIKITDTGAGIPADFLPYLFQPFSREDDSLTRHKEGLGLGLLVAKGLARKIGGDLVCVRSDIAGPQRGSQFELRVPISSGEISSRASTPNRTPTPGLASAPDPTSVSSSRRKSASKLQRHSHSPRSSPPPAQAESLNPATPSRKTIIPATNDSLSRRQSVKSAPTFDRKLASKHPLTFLVAEDNTLNRRLLVNMLGKLGYTDVHEAHDGEHAVKQMSVDRARRGEKPIDIILMDIWMPSMDGYEATERIFEMERQRHQNAHVDGQNHQQYRKKGVAVLAVTADVTDRALERASEVGMSGYLTKPYKLLDLEKKILDYCTGGGALELF